MARRLPENRIEISLFVQSTDTIAATQTDYSNRLPRSLACKASHVRWGSCLRPTTSDPTAVNKSFKL